MSQRVGTASRMSGTFLTRRRGWWRLVVLGVIILILGNYVAPVRSYLEKSSSIQHEQQLADDLKHDRDQLQQEKESLQNNNYVEQVARKDLGMVKPGEQSYVIKDLNQSEVAATVDAEPVEEQSLPDRIVSAFRSLIP